MDDELVSRTVFYDISKPVSYPAPSIVKILNLYIIFFMKSLVPLVDIYPLPAMHSLLVTLIGINQRLI